ncbi:DUF1189 family protein [Tenuibacillus multivorans]|uniref:DUF1189 domain-containing protein n=1 Tax=Tenuibacillus multivorans TaxID=237069 RepID=A0A1G9ZMJ3_9BACI|nr:DUF1189 family protein [Tenuibacillus multivorans]GEL78829.1 hypothetical protein TMU01_30640 [Tenuibacillus multivorans]SDN22702.1 Protein of unknown function [Tenuibacillus multivorans]
MNIITIFKNSLQLPKKQALFRLNRMNMRDTLVYINILFFLLFLPYAIDFVLNVKEKSGSIPDVVYIQVGFLYPALSLFITILTVSLLAVVAYGMRSALKRRLAYHQLWKMTAFALTIPIMIYFVINVFNIENFFLFILPILLFIYFFYKMITVYPRQNK